MRRDHRLKRRRGALLCFALALSAGCRDEAARAESAPSAAPAASDEPVITVDDEPESAVERDPDEAEHEHACAPPGSSLKPMQLLRMTVASGIEGKDPKDRLSVARAGRRVYAHLRMRNRSGRDRCLRVRFTVEGDTRTEVTLEIGHSWSWRTWAYATLRDDDRGPLRIEVVDDQGTRITEKSLAIVAP